MVRGLRVYTVKGSGFRAFRAECVIIKFRLDGI